MALHKTLTLTFTLSPRFLSFVFPQVSSSYAFPSPPSYYSTHIDLHQPMLVRDFVHSALYHPNHGYFSKRSASVGVLEASIKFHHLQGRKAYLRHLDKIYKQSEISWFTPAELFKPWYAHAIAEAIMRTANLSVPLKVVDQEPAQRV